MHRVPKGQALFDFARVFVEAMEPRLMFDAALSTAYAYAEANFQSAAISVGFVPSGPTTVAAGQTLTATVTSPFKMNLFCSNAGKTAVVNGTPQATTPSSSDSDDGGVLAEAGTYVMLAPGTYQVTFYIVPEAPTETIGQGVGSDGVTPTFMGNFIIGGAITPNGPGTSPLPFAVTNSNHITFINQPRSVAVNSAFSPPLQVAVEDASNNILTNDNDTSITLATNDFSTNFFNGSSVVMVSAGVATFSNLTLNSLGTYDLVACTGGITFPMAFPQFNGLVVSAASIAVNQSGVAGTAGLTPVITKDTVPSAVIAGSALHGALTLKLTNAGSTIEHGFSTYIYASPTTTLDTSVDSFVVGMSSRATVKPGKSTTQNIRIPRLPGDSPTGDIYLIAQTTDSVGNTNAVTSSSFISVQAPVLSLTPVFSGAVKVARNGTATVSLIVTNHGNIVPISTTEIQLFASTSSSVTGATEVLSKRMSLPLKPGKSKTIKLKLTKPMVQTIQNMGELVVEVTDPLGNSQTVFTVLSM